MNDTKRQGQMFRMLDVKNPFIVARFVFFALLVYLTVLQLIFAAWNISITTSAGQKVSNTPVFMIFNACLILFYLIHGVVDMAMPEKQLSSIRLECIWMAAANLLQTGIAIGATTSVSQQLCGISDQSSCASSSLAPIAWITSIILLSHFFALAIVTVAHTNVCRNIWTSTVHGIAWFGYPPVNQTDVDDFDCYDSDRKRDFGAAPERKAPEDIEKAPWAAFAKVRRGVDHPFAVDKKSAGKAHDTSLPSIPLPPYTPSKANRPIAGNGSRFIEIITGSVRKARRPNIPARFPSTVTDHDRPIPLPRRSEWIRADDIATDRSKQNSQKQ